MATSRSVGSSLSGEACIPLETLGAGLSGSGSITSAMPMMSNMLAESMQLQARQTVTQEPHERSSSLGCGSRHLLDGR